MHLFLSYHTYLLIVSWAPPIQKEREGKVEVLPFVPRYAIRATNEITVSSHMTALDVRMR